MTIEANNVTFGYDADQPIVEDVSFRCEDGETIGLVGRSGIGKSTLVNLVAGIIMPQHGEVTIDGEAPIVATRKRRIGYVPQQPTLFPYMTAQENAALPLCIGREQERRPFGAVGSMLASRKLPQVTSALETMRIEHAAVQKPTTLSIGMQTRVSLARAVCVGPRCLLLDEPFASLDDVTKIELYGEIQSLQQTLHASTVLVTHNLIEAVLLSDRVYVLSGSVVVDMPPSKVALVESISIERPRQLSMMSREGVVSVVERIRQAMVHVD